MQCHYSEEWELVEPFFSTKTGHQVRDGFALPQSKTLDPRIFLSDRTVGQNGEESEEKKVL